jgi:hypothetical protein
VRTAKCGPVNSVKTEAISPALFLKPRWRIETRLVGMPQASMRKFTEFSTKNRRHFM